MKNTAIAKTLTATLPGHAQDIFARVSDPDNLSSWFSSFCRALRKENGILTADTPRGAVPVRFIRNDYSYVLDILAEVADGIELTHAIRLLSNGDSSEIVWTIVKPEGLSDSVFHDQLRWAGSALQNLRKEAPSKPLPKAEEPKAEITMESDSAPNSDVTTPEATPSAPASGKKLFIGNLPYDWTDEQLRIHFAETGTITTAEIARFRGRGGRSRGFGFVEMGSEPEAQTAIEKLHGGLAGGRQIIVRLAKSQEARPPAPEREPKPEAAAPERRPQRAPQRATRPPRTERPRRRSRVAPSAHQPENYPDQDISNKSGYEIFPRKRSSV